jgi:hypothetical protein
MVMNVLKEIALLQLSLPCIDMCIIANYMEIKQYELISGALKELGIILKILFINYFI